MDLKIILVIKKLGSDPREKGRKLKGRRRKRKKEIEKKNKIKFWVAGTKQLEKKMPDISGR